MKKNVLCINTYIKSYKLQGLLDISFQNVSTIENIYKNKEVLGFIEKLDYSPR